MKGNSQNTATTTVVVRKDTSKELRDLSLVKNETMDSIINRLIDNFKSKGGKR